MSNRNPSIRGFYAFYSLPKGGILGNLEMRLENLKADSRVTEIYESIGTPYEFVAKVNGSKYKDLKRRNSTRIFGIFETFPIKPENQLSYMLFIDDVWRNYVPDFLQKINSLEYVRQVSHISPNLLDHNLVNDTNCQNFLIESSISNKQRFLRDKDNIGLEHELASAIVVKRL